MFTIIEKSTFVDTDDLSNYYLEFKGRRIAFFAKIKKVSVKRFKIYVESCKGEMLINIPKKFKEQLEDLELCLTQLDVKAIIEGEPYFCAFRGEVAVKKAEIKELSYS